MADTKISDETYIDLPADTALLIPMVLQGDLTPNRVGSLQDVIDAAALQIGGGGGLPTIASGHILGNNQSSPDIADDVSFFQIVQRAYLSGGAPEPFHTITAAETHIRLHAGGFVYADMGEPWKTVTAGTYTLDLEDADIMIGIDNATDVTVDLPIQVDVPFARGTTIRFMQLGAGKIILDNGTGATVNVKSGFLTQTLGQWAVIEAKKINAASTWVVFGDLDV